MEKRFGENFEDDVKINKLNLDDECEIQSEMYYYYARLLGEKKTERDQVRAKTELAIRLNPEKHIAVGAKLTEGYIEAIIKGDDALSALDQEVRLLEAAVDALEHRRSELKNLVDLFLSKYYSAPDATSDGSRDQRKKLNNR